MRAVVITYLLFGLSAACGVKGIPQPPEKPVIMSHGQPRFSKVNQDVQLKKKKSNSKPNGDFEESDDFPERDERP